MQTTLFSAVRQEQIMSHFLRYAASKICYLLAFAEYTVFWNTGYTVNNNKQKLIRLMKLTEQGLLTVKTDTILVLTRIKEFH